jgi:hypothetical protein
MSSTVLRTDAPFRCWALRSPAGLRRWRIHFSSAFLALADQSFSLWSISPCVSGTSFQPPADFPSVSFIFSFLLLQKSEPCRISSVLVDKWSFAKIAENYGDSPQILLHGTQA